MYTNKYELNKYKIYSICLLILFCSNKIFAQDNCKIQGAVVDSLGVGIYNVSIIVYNSTGKGNSFTYTDKLGHFDIKLPCNENFDIQFEHIDFNSLTVPVKTSQNNDERKKFTLLKSNIKLEEVIVAAKAPITVTGDILEFNAASFRNGKEENLEDLLKNLPGIQVDNGKVYYEGKEIKNVTVEGREIFGGNMKLINKNLPSNSINKIQLDKKFKKNPFANSLQNDDDFSLNIVLEEDKKSLVFGNVLAGTNFKEHSDFQGKAFYFNSKVDATLIGDSNTYGKEVFTREDFVGFMGGLSSLSREGGQYSLRSNVQPLNLGTVKDAFRAKTNLGAIHFGYNPNEKFYISGFALYTDYSLDYNTIVNRVFNDVSIRQDRKESQELNSSLTQARIDYFPSANSEVKYKAIMNVQDSEVGQFIGNTSQLNPSFNVLRLQSMNINRNFFNFSHNLSYIKKISKKDNLGFYIIHNYQKDRPNYSIKSTDSIFKDVFSNQNEENGIYKIKQNQVYIINTLQLYSENNYLLSNTLNLKTKLGVNFSHQEFKNNVFSQESLLSENQQKTDANLSYKEYYGDINLTKVFGSLKVDLGGSISKFDETNKVINQENSKLKETVFLPHFVLKYEWNIAKSLSLDYKKTFSYPEIKELSNTYQIQDTYTLFLGNSNLNREVNHNLKLIYRYSKYTSFLNFYSEFSFNKIEKSIQTTSLFNTDTQLNSNVNSDKDAYSYFLSFYMDKKINKHYTVELKANFSINNFYSQTTSNDNSLPVLNLIENDFFGNNFVWANNYKIKKRFEVDLGLGYSTSKYEVINKNTQFNLRNNFESWRPFTELSWMISDKFLFQTNYSYEKQTNNKKYLNEYNDLSFSLRYKLFKKTYVELIAGNLLDDQLVSNSFDSNYSQITTRKRLGAYYLINLKYKF